MFFVLGRIILAVNQTLVCVLMMESLEYSVKFIPICRAQHYMFMQWMMSVGMSIPCLVWNTSYTMAVSFISCLNSNEQARSRTCLELFFRIHIEI